ncbi:MAG TPA: DnaJ C-terminal domain-containing protein, partial [Verrucomicrobiae bacterium]|nr:DnaJ C-terminal domain-containing protein [Verrucomicrobiae bacterium]
FLRVRLARHPDFRVKEADLYHDLQLAPWEAVLGATVSVPTLDGSVSLKIAPGTQPGQQLRVRGRGLPTEGGGRHLPRAHSRRSDRGAVDPGGRQGRRGPAWRAGG